MEGFEIIGLWIIVMIALFITAMLFSLSTNDNHDPISSALYGVVVSVVIATFIFSFFFVTFKNNPEGFGYTRIESEVVHLDEGK